MLQADKSKRNNRTDQSTIRGWAGRHKTEILLAVVLAVICSPIPDLGHHVWRSIFSETTPPAEPSPQHQPTNMLIPRFQLALYVLLPYLLWTLFRYVRLYRYCSDTVFGLDFTWAYSTPFGRVCRVRAFCPVCHKRATEPVWFGPTDNYLCRNCTYDTESRRPERMEYPWRSAIQRRVYARLYKPPAA